MPPIRAVKIRSFLVCVRRALVLLLAFLASRLYVFLYCEPFHLHTVTGDTPCDTVTTRIVTQLRHAMNTTTVPNIDPAIRTAQERFRKSYVGVNTNTCPTMLLGDFLTSVVLWKGPHEEEHIEDLLDRIEASVGNHDGSVMFWRGVVNEIRAVTTSSWSSWWLYRLYYAGSIFANPKSASKYREFIGPPLRFSILPPTANHPAYRTTLYLMLFLEFFSGEEMYSREVYSPDVLYVRNLLHPFVLSILQETYFAWSNSPINRNNFVYEDGGTRMSFDVPKFDPYVGTVVGRYLWWSHTAVFRPPWAQLKRVLRIVWYVPGPYIGPHVDPAHNLLSLLIMKGEGEGADGKPSTCPLGISRNTKQEDRGYTYAVPLPPDHDQLIVNMEPGDGIYFNIAERVHWRPRSEHHCMAMLLQY
eukprot:PhF_6_TR43118/c0_g1_i4/m.65927